MTRFMSVPERVAGRTPEDDRLHRAGVEERGLWSIIHGNVRAGALDGYVLNWLKLFPGPL